MSDERNAQPQLQQVDVAVVERTQFLQCGYTVSYADDGSRSVHFFLPGGRQFTFPLGPENAQDLGRMLLAPSVEVANRMPPPGAPGGNGRR